MKEKNKIAKLLKSLGYKPSEKQIVLFVKALYGLKQSPREWQLKLKGLLEELGFKPLISDFAVFYNPRIGVFIIIYVDDCLLIGPKIDVINVIKRKWLKNTL